MKLTPRKTFLKTPVYVQTMQRVLSRILLVSID